MNSTVSLRERFLRLIDDTSTCWNWVGGVDGGGYPMFWFEGRMQRAVRLAWIFTGRSFAPGDIITQKCKNRRCMNPAHLATTDRSTIMRRWRREHACVVRASI